MSSEQETLKHTHFLMLHDLLNSYKNTIEKEVRLTDTNTERRTETKHTVRKQRLLQDATGHYSLPAPY